MEGPREDSEGSSCSWIPGGPHRGPACMGGPQRRMRPIGRAGRVQGRAGGVLRCPQQAALSSTPSSPAVVLTHRPSCSPCPQSCCGYTCYSDSTTRTGLGHRRTWCYRGQAEAYDFITKMPPGLAPTVLGKVMVEIRNLGRGSETTAMEKKGQVSQRS